MRYFNLVCGVVVATLFVGAVQPALAIQFQSNLVMHFDAANVETSGSSVTKWLNTGTTGATLDATPVTNSPQAVGSVAGINNQPVVRFDAGPVQILRTGALGSNIAQPLTIFHIGMVNNIAAVPFFYDGRVDGKRAAFYHANATATSTYAGTATFNTTGTTNGTFNSWASTYNGSTSYINQNGATSTGVGNIGTDALDGLTIGGRFVNNRMTGDIAEIAVYSGLMNAAELKIASNHFSAKYQLPVATNLYDGDNNGVGGYDFNVFGIGRSDAITGFAAGTVTSGTEGRGLTINSTGSLDVNDFVLAGDQNLGIGTTPFGDGTRSDRVWNVDQTGESNVEFEFDLITVGLGPFDSDLNYSLLYSATDPYDFSVFSRDFSISGNTVTFGILGSDLLDGFYTLSSAPPVPEPSTFGLLGMMLCGLIIRRKNKSRA